MEAGLSRRARGQSLSFASYQVFRSSTFDFNSNPPAIRYKVAPLSALGPQPWKNRRGKTVTAMHLTPLQSENLANSLRRQISGEVLCDDYRRGSFWQPTPAPLYQIQPLAVVVPKSRDDVAACIAIAAEHGVPLVARGSGTSLSGQSIGAGIVVDFSKYLNRIVDLDATSRTARRQASGVVLRPTQRGRRTAWAAIRSRRRHQQPREHRRDDRQ